mgnify:CR=1 FL=1
MTLKVNAARPPRRSAYSSFRRVLARGTHHGTLGHFIECDFDTIAIENEKIDEDKELKKKRHELLDKLFDNSPKDIKTKQVRTIDYNKVNRNTNFQTHSNMKDALKKAKLENIRKNSKR